MKKIIAVIAILALVFVIGCAEKTVEGPVVTKETPSEGPASAGITTTDIDTDVSEVESDLDNIEDLDEDFISAELEDLDTELDFEI